MPGRRVRARGVHRRLRELVGRLERTHERLLGIGVLPCAAKAVLDHHLGADHDVERRHLARVLRALRVQPRRPCRFVVADPIAHVVIRVRRPLAPLGVRGIDARHQLEPARRELERLHRLVERELLGQLDEHRPRVAQRVRALRGRDRHLRRREEQLHRLAQERRPRPQRLPARLPELVHPLRVGVRVRLLSTHPPENNVRAAR